jgi:mRNA-degrading endonuclease RelE of RelBE toxin-antitoxin system
VRPVPAEQPYGLRISFDAQRMLTHASPAGLASPVAWAAYTFITGELVRDPAGVGVPLGAALAGVHSVRQPGYRVLYEIDEEHRVVTVLVIRPE